MIDSDSFNPVWIPHRLALTPHLAPRRGKPPPVSGSRPAPNFSSLHLCHSISQTPLSFWKNLCPSQLNILVYIFVYSTGNIANRGWKWFVKWSYSQLVSTSYSYALIPASACHCFLWELLTVITSRINGESCTISHFGSSGRLTADKCLFKRK